MPDFGLEHIAIYFFRRTLCEPTLEKCCSSPKFSQMIINTLISINALVSATLLVRGILPRRLKYLDTFGCILCATRLGRLGRSIVVQGG